MTLEKYVIICVLSPQARVFVAVRFHETVLNLGTFSRRISCLNVILSLASLHSHLLETSVCISLPPSHPYIFCVYLCFLTLYTGTYLSYTPFSFHLAIALLWYVCMQSYCDPSFLYIYTTSSCTDWCRCGLPQY